MGYGQDDPHDGARSPIGHRKHSVAAHRGGWLSCDCRVEGGGGLRDYGKKPQVVLGNIKQEKTNQKTYKSELAALDRLHLALTTALNQILEARKREITADCGNSKRYKGKRQPGCLDGIGCNRCWDKYSAQMTRKS